MCLILIAYRCHAGYELVVAANRDEFLTRPTAPLAFWDDAPHVLAGRDLQGGGTWMGLSRTGRFAALTNYRDPNRVRSRAPSRGQLVSTYLQGTIPAQTFLEKIQEAAEQYNSFNLLLGDQAGLYYYSNRAGAAPRMLAPGFYGLSNHLLDTPWPKLKRGMTRFRDILAHHSHPPVDALLALLTDRTLASDAELPQTGVPLEWERWLSAIFVDAPGYGTRSSTILCIDQTGHARITEVTWADGSRQEVQCPWPIPPIDPPIVAACSPAGRSAMLPADAGTPLACPDSSVG